jgi:NitT/TauT family transport system substrate-binding protein
MTRKDGKARQGAQAKARVRARARSRAAAAALAAALLLAATLAGCGGGQAGTTAAATTAAATTEAATTAAAEAATTEAAAVDEAQEAAPAGAAVAPPEQATFNLGHLNSTAHLLGFVAKEEGYFEEEGLDVTLTLFASAGEMVTALESGKLDAAFIGSVPTITFQSQGHPVSIFGGAMTNGHGYVAKPELLEGVADGEADITVLKGHNVASVKNSVQDLELQVLLTNAGLKYKEADPADNDVNVVYFDSQKDAFNAIAGSEIDAVSVYSPYASLAQSQGYKVIYYCGDEPDFKNQPCCRQVALTDALAAKPATYQAFERALIRAYKFSQEDQEKTIADVKAYIDIDAEFIRTEVYGGYAESHPDPDKAATKSLHDSVIDFGYTGGYDIEPLYDTSVYEAALNQVAAANPGDAVYQRMLERFAESN